MCFLFVDAGKSGRMYTGITKCFQFEEGAAVAQTGPCWGLKHLLSFVVVFVWFACAYSFVICHTEKKHVAHPCMFDRYRANIGGFLTWCTPYHSIIDHFSIVLVLKPMNLFCKTPF
jgi:hypothetical protein